MTCVRGSSPRHRRRRRHADSNDLGPPETTYTEENGDVSSIVYFVLDRDACQVKIGLTDNLERRMCELGWRRKGHELELLASLDGGYNLERAMHGRFRPWRVEGREWYSSEIAQDVLLL
jgi:hypothetical protein